MFTGDMIVQLVLSYNTVYKVNVTQHSACQLLIRTAIVELNFSKLYENYNSTACQNVIPADKCSDPMELTNALALGYVDPALEGQTIMFVCLPGQTLNGSNSSTCMGNGEWEPDPGEMECTGSIVTTGTSLTIGTCTCLVMMHVQCFNTRLFSLFLLEIFPPDVYLL
jgi:hypothetical protein